MENTLKINQTLIILKKEFIKTYWWRVFGNMNYSLKTNPSGNLYIKYFIQTLIDCMLFF